MRIHQKASKIYHTNTKNLVNCDWVIRFFWQFFVIIELRSQIYIVKSAIMIMGPRSDLSLPMSLTHWLTHWLSHKLGCQGSKDIGSCKSITPFPKFGSWVQKWSKIAKKTDHSIAIYSIFCIGMVYFGCRQVNPHIQAVQNMCGKGG